MRSFRKLTLAVTVLALAPLLVSAALFTDLATSDPNYEDIVAMANIGVVKGYDDGSIKSGNKINRAEFATMLTRALGVTPPKVTASTFVDVPTYAWYADVIGYLSDSKVGVLTGYADGTMKPEKPVSFAEALAMTMRAFKISVPDTTDESVAVLKWVNASTAAWYTKYLAAGYNIGMLPVRGQNTTQFNPDVPQTRGQTLGILNAGIMVKNKGTNSTSSSAQTTSSAASQTARSSKSSSAASSVAFNSKNVTIPFTEAGTTTSMSYFFNLTDKRTVLSINMMLTGYYDATLSCRLYKLEQGGTPNQLNSSNDQNYVTYEYYLGVVSTGRCDLMPALAPGKYQLEVYSNKAGANYSVTAKKTDGTGNDGFVDAQQLQFNVARTAVMNAGDIYDAYQFTVTKAGSYTVELSGVNAVDGFVYEPAGVTSESFAAPVINKPYNFQPATYTVIVSHKHPLNEKVVYSVSVKSQ
ncbi:MAG: S-layer homology domain-containing protein [Candidatus Peribacteraceae bacterium]|nr:S-layer homology domain-containing protein [Candidatus Peribacteraceae bacterium]